MPALRGGRLQLRDRAVVVDNDHVSMSTTRRLRLVTFLSQLRRSPQAAPQGRQQRPPAPRSCARAQAARSPRSPPRGQGRAPKTGWRAVRRRLGKPRRLRHARRSRARPARQSFRSATRRCVVLSGRLSDPYTSTTIVFARGAPRSTSITSSPSVTRGRGRLAWPHAKRVAFANDPLNLLAVDASANRRRAMATRRPGCRQQALSPRLRRAPGLGQLKYALGHGRRATRCAGCRQCPTQRVT